MDKSTLQHRILVVRDQRVMLDFELASLYGVETKALNQAVKRNITRFPADFMFQLTKSEWFLLNSQQLLLKSQIVTTEQADNKELTILRSQIVTAKSTNKSRSLPYAFTELGVAMLSSVLRSPAAIQVNIGIMRAFVALRSLSSQPINEYDDTELKKEIRALRDDLEAILSDQNDINESTQAQLDAISVALSELQMTKTKSSHRQVGFIQPRE